jgi:xylan 1,4-beta-xylosidase
MRLIILILFSLVVLLSSKAQTNKPKTFCNPINIDYGYTPIPNFSEWGRHRATADPVIVNYKGDYFLFSTNQWGYWWSSDMSEWHFIPRLFLRPWNKSYDELCAPAVGIIGDTMIVFGSTYTSDFTIWMSTNPKTDDWKPLVERFEIGGWDPAFFTDTDGRLYMYNGSSNRYPLYGIEINRKTLDPVGTRTEVLLLDSWRYGWQRFGEYMDDTFLDAFMEGAWLTKHKDKYYLQYGAPGTELSGYADGVAVGDSPLGPFIHQSDPYSMKLGGFVKGAGHGSTFKDNEDNYWHISTVMISVKNNFERRLGIWPAGFDNDGVMWCNTAFGDYPLYLPANKLHHNRPEWYLLNYCKPVQVSSTHGGFHANYVNDENIRTYWSAASGDAGEWMQTDLGDISTVHAVQINFADQDVDSAQLGKINGGEQFHQYRILYSQDGKKWNTLIDKSRNKTDVPHDYVELDQPAKARFLKIENLHIPSGKFALSGFRVFGLGNGTKPDAVKDFMVLRTEKDKRSAWIRWSPVSNAYAYNIYYGTHPDKLYNCIMVYANNEYWFKGMDLEKTYYYSIEAINESGVSGRYSILEIR